MAALSVFIASSLLSHTTQKPSPPPNRRRIAKLTKPYPRPPLLSDDSQNLSDRNGSSSSSSSADSDATRRLLKYYARLASKLARNGELREFLTIVESVLTSEAVPGEHRRFVSRLDTRLVSVGIASALRGGSLDEVLGFLGGVERLGICPSELFHEDASEALKDECLSLLNAGRLDEFVELMETLAGYQFFVSDIVDPIDILKIFIEKRDPTMAVRFANIFPHSQHLVCSVIQEFGKKKDMTSAISVFEAFKQRSGGISMFVCRSIIDICGYCNDFLKSRRIFKELLAQKITPNAYVFNSLMNVNAHDLSYTMQVYKHMQGLGVIADITSYNILLKACCNAKQVDLAQEIYKEVKHVASNGALKLNVITYSSMIKVFADAKMWQMALKIKEDMLLSEISPNIVAWSSLISACANSGLVDHAIQLFDEMLLSGCEPNAHSCNALLYACIESFQYDRAFRFFHNWKEYGFKIFRAVNGITVKNPSEEASSLCVIVPFRPTVATFNILMKACGTDHYRAEALMTEMKTLGLTPNHISWSILIDVYGTSQNMSGAIQAFRTMIYVGIKVDVVAYTTAIKACVENKNLMIAFSLFEEMKRYRLQPNLVTYNTLLRARSRYGSLHEIQQCLAIYQDMRKAGYNANDYYLKQLIEEWCEGVICSSNQNQGQLSIVNFYKESNKKNQNNLLLEKVAKHLQKDGGDKQAIDIRGLTEVEARIVVLSVLRMMKESYRLGKAIEDDMIIIFGAGRGSDSSSCHGLEVKHVIIKVLQDELGLNVINGRGAVPINQSLSHSDDDDGGGGDVCDSTVSEKAELPKDYRYQARKPRDLGVLKVSQESLYNWLQGKVRD